ncbi:uncharacterized protein [Ptychodera flava]|uniref:uncharacterized protein n=1 Tax=Ptychodera flava TaxID=63121 RepID=UPI00396A3914
MENARTNARITRATTEAFDKTKSTFKSYYNRMERFYRVNGITEEEDQKDALLYCIGQTAFSELEDILLPAKPADKSLAEIVACLEKYYDPARMELAGAFHFLKRDQKPGESVQDYITALKQKLPVRFSTMAYVQSRNLVAALIRNGTTNTCPKAVCRLSTSKLVNCDLRSGNSEMMYENLSRKHIIEAARLVTDHLSKHIPMIHHLRVPDEAYFKRNMAALENVLQSGEGAVAIDTTSNRVIGVAYGFWVSNFQQFEYSLDPTMCEEFKPMRLLLSKLGETFFSLEDVKKLQTEGHRFLSLDTAVINSKYRRTGVMRYFANWILEVARSKGVRVTCARANHKQSLMYVKGLGFEVLDEIPYREFEIDGRKPFEDMEVDPEFKGSAILIRRLNIDERTQHMH